MLLFQLCHTDTVTVTTSLPLRLLPNPSNLNTSPGRPPGWVFGPAWTLLYGLMGLSAHLAWQTGTTSFDPTKLTLAKQGATLYTIQLGLNLIWMPLFFRFKQPIAATVDIVTLTGLTGWLIYVWGQVDERAGWLLTPYLGWLGFATYLTIGVGYLNDWDLSDKTRPKDGKKSTGMVNEKP